MKKVQTITQAPVATLAPATPTLASSIAPPPLMEQETHIMQLLVGEVKTAQNALSHYVGQVLTARQLDVKEWGISLADCKTLVKNPPQTTAPPAAAAIPIPPAPTA